MDYSQSHRRYGRVDGHRVLLYRGHIKARTKLFIQDTFCFCLPAMLTLAHVVSWQIHSIYPKATGSILCSDFIPSLKGLEGCPSSRLERMGPANPSGGIVLGVKESPASWNMAVLQPKTKEIMRPRLDHPSSMFQLLGVYCTLQEAWTAPPRQFFRSFRDTALNIKVPPTPGLKGSQALVFSASTAQKPKHVRSLG